RRLEARHSDAEYLSVFIHCNPDSESTLWSSEAQVEFRLHSRRPGVPLLSRQFTKKLNFYTKTDGFPSFIKWRDIMDVNQGYIEDNKVMIEALVTVRKVVGVRNTDCIDFYSQEPHTSDGVLVIGEVRLHVNKAYLALHSPVFYAMFFGEFSEHDKCEIPIEGVILDEFIELLNVVYPSRKPITTENVEFLLELSDKFDIRYVIDECERFLISTQSIDIGKKLVLAGKYYLEKLENDCVRKFSTTENFKKLRRSEDYEDLSDATKVTLLEKLFKILNI
ncbi:BTB/POZ domain protein, partial [Dictyocaulus viviparus]